MFSVFIQQVLEKIFGVEIYAKIAYLAILIVGDEKRVNSAIFGEFWVFEKQVPQVDTKTHAPKSILPWIESLYRCLSLPGARYSMCTHQAHHHTHTPR